MTKWLINSMDNGHIRQIQGLKDDLGITNSKTNIIQEIGVSNFAVVTFPTF